MLNRRNAQLLRLYIRIRTTKSMKTMNVLKTLGLAAVSAMVISSCQKDTSAVSYTDAEYQTLSQILDLPGEVYDYTIQGSNAGVPFDIQVPGHGSLEDRNHKATLGRVLFYDQLLSKDGTVSCGTCHVQSAGFAHNEALSEGIEGQVGTRNSLALGTTPLGLETSYGGGSSFNGDVFFNGQIAGFSWDESVHSMNEQSQKAIENPVEMGMTMEAMVDRVNSLAYYDILFNKAFGENEITETKILDAISSFVNAISSNQTKFDEGLAMTHDAFEDFPNYSEVQNLGKNLFNNNCSSCHGSEHKFTQRATANNGLDLVYTDKGRGEVTGLSHDNGVFKIPFLRNIELSGPYMHDGRFATLEEVVDFYSTGIKGHQNLDPSLKDWNGQVKRFNFTSAEKSALVAYLETLTDHKMKKEQKFADPFKG